MSVPKLKKKSNYSPLGAPWLMSGDEISLKISKNRQFLKSFLLPCPITLGSNISYQFSSNYLPSSNNYVDSTRPQKSVRAKAVA